MKNYHLILLLLKRMRSDFIKKKRKKEKKEEKELKEDFDKLDDISVYLDRRKTSEFQSINTALKPLNLTPKHLLTTRYISSLLPP